MLRYIYNVYSGMDKEDALIVFEDFIRNAEKVHEGEKVLLMLFSC